MLSTKTLLLFLQLDTIPTIHIKKEKKEQLHNSPFVFVIDLIATLHSSQSILVVFQIFYEWSLAFHKHLTRMI